MKISKHPPTTNTHILSFPSLEGVVHAFLDTNVLFDYDLKRKISYFGLARFFEGNRSHEVRHKVYS